MGKEQDLDWLKSNNKNLQQIPMMLENGFKLEFSYKDEMHGRITPSKPPIYGVNFIKGDLVVWKIKQGYQTANLIDGSYKNHKTFKNLRQVLLNK